MLFLKSLTQKTYILTPMKQKWHSVILTSQRSKYDRRGVRLKGPQYHWPFFTQNIQTCSRIFINVAEIQLSSAKIAKKWPPSYMTFSKKFAEVRCAVSISFISTYANGNWILTPEHNCRSLVLEYIISPFDPVWRQHYTRPVRLLFGHFWADMRPLFWFLYGMLVSSHSNALF